MTGTWLTYADEADGDFVTASILDFWAGTGQLDGVNGHMAHHLDEADMRLLGFQASYGDGWSFGPDPQNHTAGLAISDPWAAGSLWRNG